MTKTILSVFTALLLSSTAMAQTSTSTSGATSGSTSGAISGSTSQSTTGASTSGANAATGSSTAGATTGGSTANLTLSQPSTTNAYQPNDITIRNVPQVYAPNVVTGNVCALGASAGGSVIGFGLSVGASWESMQCERRQTAALLWNMSTPEARAAAKEVLCNSSELRAAFKTTGSPCAADVPQPPAVSQLPAPPPGPIASRVVFQPALYPSASECLNAAVAARAPFTECNGKR